MTESPGFLDSEPLFSLLMSIPGGFSLGAGFSLSLSYHWFLSAVRGWGARILLSLLIPGGFWLAGWFLAIVAQGFW